VTTFTKVESIVPLMLEQLADTVGQCSHLIVSDQRSAALKMLLTMANYLLRDAAARKK